MEGGIQSSFIPKDAGTVTTAPRLERSGGLSDLLLLVAIVLFVASCALGGAVFLYKQYLETTAASKVQELQAARAAFDPNLIQQLTRLDDRMRAAEGVLTAHIAPTAFFAALEQATLTTISFKSLDLQATDPKKITIHMAGIARSVNSIALEADLLSKNGVVTNPIFSGISRQADGVHFDLVALLNPSAIGYIGFISGAPQGAAAIQAPANPSPTPEANTAQQAASSTPVVPAASVAPAKTPAPVVPKPTTAAPKAPSVSETPTPKPSKPASVKAPNSND